MISFAQDGPDGTIIDHGKIIDLDKDGDLIVLEGENCIPYVEVRVRLSNLDSFGGGQFGIPLSSPILQNPGGPNVFLHYQIGTASGALMLDNTFEFLTSSTSGIDVFEKEFLIPLNIEDISIICYENLITFEFSFVNNSGNIFSIYNLSNEGNIFDCSWFVETGCQCTLAPCIGLTPDGLSVIGGLYAKDYCEECEPQEIQIILRSDKNFESNLIFSPNPFKEYTKLELTLIEDSPIEVAIYDATGRIITSWEEHVSKGDYTKEFITTDWQNGLYFGLVRIGDKTESFQMIKID